MSNRRVWLLVENRRLHMYDSVVVVKENNSFAIHRFIEDSDEDGETIYSLEEHLRGMSADQLKRESSSYRAN